MVTQIKSGNAADSEAIMGLTGQLFKNQLQTICNADLIGINAKMNLAAGTLNLSKTLYNSGVSDTSDTSYNFTYDGTNKYWACTDYSAATIGTEYVIVEATSLSSPISINNCVSLKIGAGKWIIYCTTGTDAVRRAQIIKTLFYGTNGTDAKILAFTGITALKTSHANDVGKRAYYASGTKTGAATGNYTGTFADTSTNSNCSIWSIVSTNDIFGSSWARWEIPSGTILNSVGPSAAGSVDELGLDKTADELNNPATCKINLSGATGGSSESGKAVIICNGAISWVATTMATSSNTDFMATYPVFSAVGTQAAEGVYTSTLIFGDTASATTTNAIMCANYSIDATSSIQYSMSANGTNFVNCTDSTICDFVNTGTNLQRKIVITRTDLSKIDKVSQEGVIYNVRQ